MYLIGVCNLVIETDAQYIKGMLANPDIQPSASINHWIVSILIFHFTLVHVKRTYHGPDGLLHCPRQPEDSDNEDEEDEEDFNDYIYHLHGFIHMIHDFNLPTTPTTSSLALSLARARISSEGEIDDYNQVPRNKKAMADDLKLEMVCKWHKDLVQPTDISDKHYSKFLRYVTKFFPDHDHLWQKDSYGEHKLVLHPN
jgi:hypothetical protein